MMRELPEWYYDEFIQVGTDYTDKEEILHYDRKMQKIRDIGSEAETMLQLIGLQQEERVLEIGCGTGEFSIELSRHCKQVIALDVSGGCLNSPGKRQSQETGTISSSPKEVFSHSNPMTGRSMRW
jgi:ubiquinone/menaquinone biosynthesis C-methylase UbiE